MNKRAEANLITVILLILIILILVVALWNIFFLLVKPGAEEVEIKSRLLGTNVKVKGIEGNLLNPEDINITLRRGAERLVLKNKTIIDQSYVEVIDITPNASIITAVDISGSMRLNATWSTTQCDANNSCNTQDTCENICYGNWENNACLLETYTPTCCRDNDCETREGCEDVCNGNFAEGFIDPDSGHPLASFCWTSNCCTENGCSSNETCIDNCGGIWMEWREIDWWLKPSVEREYCNSPNSMTRITSCLNNQNCENYCNGTYNHTTFTDYKIKLAREANLEFINEMFDAPADHKIGLIAFESHVNSSFTQELVSKSQRILLEDKVNALTAWGGTYINEGLNASLELIKDEPNDKVKAIILMTDGQVGEVDANQSNYTAKKAWEDYNIHVYTIGYAVGVGTSYERRLKAIAQNGNGSYFASSTSSLSERYREVREEIEHTIQVERKIFESVKKWDHLKFIFYSETDSWSKDEFEVLNPLETKKYTIEDVGDFITDIKTVQVYLAVYDSKGNEVLGPLLDEWKAEDN